MVNFLFDVGPTAEDLSIRDSMEAEVDRIPNAETTGHGAMKGFMDFSFRYEGGARAAIEKVRQIIVESNLNERAQVTLEFMEPLQPPGIRIPRGV